MDCSDRVPPEDWSLQVEGVEVVDDFMVSIRYHQVPMTASDVYWDEQEIDIP